MATTQHPQYNPIYKDFANRLSSQYINIDKFLNSYPAIKDDVPMQKALKNVRNMLLEAQDYMYEFYKETEKYFQQLTINEALKETCRHQREELEQYRNFKRLLLSDEKENIIRTVVLSLEKLLERE